jgi:hypothetical protein
MFPPHLAGIVRDDKLEGLHICYTIGHFQFTVVGIIVYSLVFTNYSAIGIYYLHINAADTEIFAACLELTRRSLAKAGCPSYAIASAGEAAVRS